MRRTRTRAWNAVAVLAPTAAVIGAAACTPQQQASVGFGISQFLTLLGWIWAQSVGGLPPA